jgi:allophanate hydrolase subunit 1
VRPADARAQARVLPYGDDALLVELVNREAPAGIMAARRARALAEAIAGRAAAGDPALAGVGVPVAGAASVLVPIPLDAQSDAWTEVLLALAATIPADPPPPRDARGHRLVVHYGGEDGPDLEAVADLAGLTPDEVVRLHGSVVYEVLFLGFTPGFGYLGELPDPLRMPRLATPRVSVPAGSVAIAGSLTAVYPQDSPGGWRLIGRCGTPMFDPDAPEPVLLRAGDRVRFTPA